MTPIAFPDPGQFEDQDFVAFAIVTALVLDQFKTNTDIDPIGALKTLWAAATGRPELTDFSAQLNARVKAENWLERLGLPEDCSFRAVGVHYYCREHGHQTVETIAVGVQSASGPPPDVDPVTEAAFNDVVAECAAAAGFVSSQCHGQAHVLSATPGMSEALQKQVELKIDAETEKFRSELDSVFQTWKGGTDDSHQSE